MIEVFDVENERSGMVAFRIDPRLWNEGICTEAMQRVIDFFFTETEMERLQLMKELSMERPACAMQDESAIFVNGGKVRLIGRIYRIEQGEIRLFTEKDVHLPGPARM